MYYKQKWSSRRVVVKTMCPFATTLGTYLPEGDLVHSYKIITVFGFRDLVRSLFLSRPKYAIRKLEFSVE